MKKILAIFVFALVFCGCVSTKPAVSARQTNAIFLEKKGKNIFVSTSNVSTCGIHLQSKISSLLEQKGYKITAGKNDADIVLQAQVLHCDHKRENNKVIGGLIGAGTALGIAAHNHAGGWAKVGWSTLGAAIGVSMAHLSEDETWDLQVGLKITSKHSASQETTIFAKVSKMALSGTDAAPVLEDQVAQQIAKIL